MTAPAAVSRRPLLEELGPALLAFGLIVFGIAVRPLIPIDETRYLTVAWEMHQGGDWLVPHLNGAPYSHKPPALFWLINTVWAIGGPKEFLGRLAPTLFFPVAVWLTGVLGARIGGREVGLRAALMTAAMTVFAVYGSLVMFDSLLTCAALVAMLGWIEAAHGRPWRGFVMAGLAMGLGVLIKGPAILIHTLPVAVFAPLWAPRGQTWARWYLAMLGAVLLGAVVALSWALPAAFAGGPEFEKMILWGQTAGRMVKSFDHARPVWFFIELLPVVVFPWIFSINAWAGLIKRPFAGLNEPMVRLPLIGAVAIFVIFSLISGKQLHYVLPALPLLAILISVGFQRLERQRAEILFPIVTAVVGAAFVAVGLMPGKIGVVIHPIAGVLLLAVAVVLWFIRRRPVAAGVLAGVALFSGIHLAGQGEEFGKNRVDWAAERLAAHRSEDMAFAGEYSGEFGYLARLTHPIEVIEVGEAKVWRETHPNGCVAVFFHTEDGDPGVAFDEVRAYRGGKLGVSCE